MSKKSIHPSMFEYWEAHMSAARYINIRNSVGVLLCSVEFARPPFYSEDGATLIGRFASESKVKRSGMAAKAFVVDVKGRELFPMEIGWRGLMLASNMLYSGMPMRIDQFTLTVPFN